MLPSIRQNGGNTLTGRAGQRDGSDGRIVENPMGLPLSPFYDWK